ncbi:MAG: hypothetical protein E7020_05390 [Alphaproteobacteria bacterium]|nr:hypothetical protein [Alphaproteobacteria bacterium]
MKRFNIRESYQKGSMMIEALALLGLITMVTPILYKKAAERTTELQDINVATQMRTISSAVDQYIKDNYKTVGEEHAGESIFALTDAEMDEVAKYLPHGFDLAGSKLFNDFEVAVRKREVTDMNGEVHNTFTSAVLAPLRDSISMMRSSKIASMIGANGGVYRNNQIDGVQGTWQATLGDYGLEPAEEEPVVKDGSLVVVSTEAITSATAAGAVSDDDVLYRVDDGDEEKNTMQTTLYMGGNDLASVGHLIAAGEKITIGKDENDSGLDVLGNLLTEGTSNLVGSVTVGDGTNSSDLTVQKGNLGVTGNATVSGTGSFGDKVTINKPEEGGSGGGLAVTGDTSLAGNLSQSGGSVSLGDTSNTMDLKASTMTGGATDITLTATGTATVSGAEVVLSGTNSVDIGTANQGIYFEEGVGTTVAGKTTFNDEVTFNDKVTLTGTGGEITLDPNDAEGSKVTAEWVVANQGIKLGNGTFRAAGEGFEFTDMNNNPRLSIKDGESHIGVYLGAGVSKGLTVKSDSTKVADVNSYMELTDGNATLAFDKDADGNTWVRTAENEVTLGVGTGGDISTTEVHSLIKATDSEVGMEYKSGTDGVRDSSVYLSDSGIAVGSPNMLVDEYGIALAKTGANFDDSTKSANVDENGNALYDAEDDVTPKSILGDNSNVTISRRGIIEVGSDDLNTGGYIRARRLVSDIKVPDAAAFHKATVGATSEDGDASKGYDYYQVNPAYTSVMNDIKLTTRGGARLSDILPDYINKGIYVADNTFADSSTKLANGWEKNIGDIDEDGLDDYQGLSALAEIGKDLNKGITVSGITDCEDSSCIASPWLGFIPAPQCPRNYNKAIAINPIRWRMSEVYAVYDSETNRIKDLAMDNYNEVITGKGDMEHSGDNTYPYKFVNYFSYFTNPRDAIFSLDSASGTESHTHDIAPGMPLTFQTNTWLNTTISQVFTKKDTNEESSIRNAEMLHGWHAVMGFVYPVSYYSDLLGDIGYATDADQIYWNVFPVYAGDMAAVATVYCLFDRNPEINGDRDWTWGDNSPVDQYDQIYNYRTGFTRDSGWLEQVNDPDLDYDDPW